MWLRRNPKKGNKKTDRTRPREDREEEDTEEHQPEQEQAEEEETTRLKDIKEQEQDEATEGSNIKIIKMGTLKILRTRHREMGNMKREFHIHELFTDSQCEEEESNSSTGWDIKEEEAGIGAEGMARKDREDSRPTKEQATTIMEEYKADIGWNRSLLNNSSRR